MDTHKVFLQHLGPTGFPYGTLSIYKLHSGLYWCPVPHVCWRQDFHFTLKDCCGLQCCILRVEDWCVENCIWLLCGGVLPSFIWDNFVQVLSPWFSTLNHEPFMNPRSESYLLPQSPSWWSHHCYNLKGCSNFEIPNQDLNVEAILFVYNTLIWWSVLKYGSVVWSPHQIGHIQRIQSYRIDF